MRRSSFRQRQYLTLITLAILPMIIVMGTVLPSTRNLIVEQTTAQLETVADLKTAQVVQWLNQGREVARLTVNLRQVQEKFPVLVASVDAAAEVRPGLYAELDALVDNFPSVRSVSLLHPVSGEVLLSTDRVQEGRVRADEDYFLRGQHELYISPVAYSVGREAPELIVSAPAWIEADAAPGTELIAVVAVEMDLADLGTTLASRAGLGETGRAYLVDAFGFYVTLPSGVPGQPLRVIAKSEGVRRAVGGQNGSSIYDDPRDVRVLGVHRWLPDVTLGLLVEMEETELSGEITHSWLLIVLISLEV